MNRTLRCFALAVVALLSTAAQADRELRFGVYAADKPSEMVRAFRPTLNLLERALTKKLGEETTIRMEVAGAYEEGVADLVKGRVDFSQFGPVSYINAKTALPTLQILAMETNEGTKSFNGAIVVAERSPLQRIDELRGKRFAFGDETSTIGRYLAQLHLLEHGVHARDLAKYDYLLRHDAVASAVAEGRYDAGAVKESALRKQNKQEKRLRVLLLFPNVTKPWVAAPSLAPDALEALRSGLLELKDAEALQALGADGFAPGDDAEYDRIRQAMERNPEFFR